MRSFCGRDILSLKEFGREEYFRVLGAVTFSSFLGPSDHLYKLYKTNEFKTFIEQEGCFTKLVLIHSIFTFIMFGFIVSLLFRKIIRN